MVSATFAAAFAKKRNGEFRTPDECIKLCADAGFTHIDWSPNYGRPDWKEDIGRAIRAAEKYGITIMQSHTPYNFYARAPLDHFQKQLGESVEAAHEMGVKNLVFHFDEYHPAPGTPFDPDEAMKTIYEIMAPYIEKTVSYGINAALETIIEDHIRVKSDERSHFGGTFEELTASIERFHDDRVTCCWDFGHAQLSYGDKHAENLLKMGSRITCTHVHDNYYGKDLHLLPYLGNLDWERLIPALRATGYDGALTYEGGYGCLPDSLIAEYIGLSAHIMNTLCDIK
ncbi:MAG: sugar phosphate isomerase/epimerase [Ruminococcus sp.]|nr:sugar phosphate isomerase/epimerase [Candidatus Apopatosoma intestinale]